MIYICDFETTTEKVWENKTRIYLWGLIRLNDKKNAFNFDVDLKTFFNFIEKPEKRITKIYFHNLNFDGAFIIKYLINESDYFYTPINLKNANRFKNSKEYFKIKNKKCFSVLILNGKLYQIELFIFNRIIKIVCSQNILISSVKKIGEELKIYKRLKNMDYDKYAFFENKNELLIETLKRKIKHNDNFFYFTNKNELIKNEKHILNKICDEKNKCVICYLFYDLIIIKKTFSEIRKSKIRFKLTISSTAFSNFKNWFKKNIGDYKYLNWFGGKDWKNKISNNILNLNEWKTIKKSYSGGFTAFKNNLVNKKLIGNINAYDVNSLYPSVMKNEKLPYGKMLSKKPNITDFATLIIVNISFIKMKEKYILKNYPPFFRKKNKIVELDGRNNNEHFIYSFYQKHNNLFSFWIEEWEFLKKYYHIQFENYEEKYFKLNNFFNKYIEKMKKFKENSIGVLRMFYKIFLNSLYGKFSQNHENLNTKICDIKKLDDRILEIDYAEKNGLSEFEYKIQKEGYLSFKNDNNNFLKNNKQKDFLDKDKTIFYYKHKEKIELLKSGKPKSKILSYIPLASYITMKSRMLLFSAIEKNIDNFIYADTDSIYLFNELKNCEIHATKFGAWKFEGQFNKMKVLRSKCYAIQKEGENIKFVISSVKKDATKILNWDNFKIGTTIKNGNLRSFKVDGGILLKEQEITI